VLSDRQIVELFHLHFVRLLCAGADRDRFGIKGGCNLRFFFESVWHSEDIDFDVAGIPVHTLKEKVNKILGGPALAMPLRSRGVSIAAVTAPKQTETTQRWKVGLSTGATLPLHTKLEFSRRPKTEGAVVEPVSAAVLAEFQMMPVLAPHYPLPAALRQKVGVLVGRSTVQARDVFDLSVLLSRAGGRIDALRSMRAQIKKAIERAMDVSYDEFKAQVASYLKPEHLDEYGTRQAWEAMQAQVVDALEKAAP
jgi:Nucleotidyl transferase AbiEii toxin, Type IV TA system